jgi:hypothetical protein
MALHLAGVFVAALAAWPLAAQSDVQRGGKTFKIVLHPGKLEAALAERMADEALAAVEALQPMLDKWQVRAPKATLHVHATQDTFHAIEKLSTEFQFTVGAFATADGSEAHVLMSPALSPLILEQLGLPPSVARSLQVMAGETAALQFSEAARQDRLLARIFAYGLVDAVVDPGNKCGVDPDFDDRRTIYTGAWQKERTLSFADVFGGERPRSPRDLDLQIEQASFFAQLAAESNPGWARKLLAKPAKGSSGRTASDAVIESIFGKDVAKADRRLAALVAATKPVWYISGGCVGSRGGKIVLAGEEKQTGSLRVCTKAPDPPYAIRGRASMAAGPRPELRVVIDDSENSAFCVLIGPQYVSAVPFDKKSEKYGPGGEGSCEWKLGTEVEIAIEIDKEVRVSLDGRPVVTCARPRTPLSGSWALEVNNTLVWLRDWRCEPLQAAKK